MVRLWTILLISGAVACFLAWAGLALREAGLSSLQGVRRTFRGHSKYGKAVLGFVFCGLFVLCATKPQAGGNGEPGSGDGGNPGGGTNGVQNVGGEMGGSNGVQNVGGDALTGLTGLTGYGDGGGQGVPALPVANSQLPTSSGAFSADDLARGFVFVGAVTNGTAGFDPPSGAVVCGDWLSHGAAYDRMYAAFGDWAMRIGTNWFESVRAFSFGRVDPLPPATNRWFAPLCANFGVVPAANWQLLGNGEQGTGNGSESQFWHAITPSNTLLMTWRDVLLDRDVSKPLSFQIEVAPEGAFEYRYDFSRLGVDEVSNILVGASFGEIEWTTNALPANLTSLSFHRLLPEDAVDPDRDGDGVLTSDEIFVHGTDPGLWDTDYDGLSDGVEVAQGTDPHTRDSDGDGFADGTDVRPLEADSWTDADGDGLPDAWRDGWFGTNATVAAAGDANGDGISNLAALMMGVNPVAPPAAGFAASQDAGGMTAWEIAPSAFSFVRPAGLTNLLNRTFAVNRESPWEQFFVSARPDRAEGWAMSDVALLYGFDGDPITNEVPIAGRDSWRIPLGDAMPQTVSFRIEASGNEPGLSAPLYLIRWAPRIVFLPSPDVAVIDGTNGHVYAAAKRKPETGAYEVPFLADVSGIPHKGGVDAGVAADLALPPVEDLAVSNGVERAFLAEDPMMVELPKEGTNLSKRILFYEIGIERAGAVKSGPRTSRYASPYPLTSTELRKSFHVARGEASDGSVSLTLSPDVPELGIEAISRNLRGGGLRGGAGSKTETVYPPVMVTPTVLGDQCTNDTYEIDFAYPEYHDETPPEDDESEDGCGCCGDGDTSLGSFRIRIPFGESAKDENLGYLWTVVDGPLAVNPSAFNVLAAQGVTVVTNADGTLSITCTANGGKALMVTNSAHGVAIPVWNASGRFESRWDVWNEGGDSSRIRVREVTVLGNATVDETYATWTDEAPVVFDGTRDVPADVWERTDNIRGVTVTRYEWRDADEGDFVTEEYEETRLGEDLVRAELRTYAKVGAGSAAKRRLVCTTGYDENGWHETVRTYWCDTDHPDRHARLKSVRSDSQAWAWYGYDDAGRETVRIEQLDGSPFPEFEDVSPDAVLPPDCSAKITVTGYEPQRGDDAHRNDSFEPRDVSVYVRHGGETPVLIAHETRLYTREADAAGNPLRRIVKNVGLDGAARTETTVEYPQDSDVPPYLRGLPVLASNADGSVTATAYSLSGGSLVSEAHTEFGVVERQTYTRTVSDAAYRMPLRSETRLSSNGALLEWEDRTYDDVRRLRSVSYSDGTSETNAYSCCRLLWGRDRLGRKVLRSAQTGTDSLYYADEDVWLGELGNREQGTGNGGADVTNGFKVTRHYFDGFGRETNTVIHIGSVPGEASAMSSPYPSQSSYTSQQTTAYLDGDRDGVSETVDERGAVTARWRYDDESREERYETVSTNGAEIVRTTTATLRNGGSSVRREWGWGNFTEERRFTDYAADGKRIDYVVTSSYDNGTVTNSVSTYDLLGRLISSSVRGMNGSTLVTANTYDGASARILSSTYTASNIVRTTTCLYNQFGEQVGTVLDGITNRTDITYEQFSNEWWKVETAAVIGPHTNSLTITRTQLTGLSDSCRRHTIEMVGRCAPTPPPGGSPSSATVTETIATYNPGTKIETETVTSSIAPTVTRRRMYGLLLSVEPEGTTTYNCYDAFGRVTATSRTIGEGEPSLVKTFEYAPCGDLIAKHTYTNGTDVITESYSYDMLGNRIATTDDLGNTTYRTYDPLGNVITEDGATYPVRYAYDTAGRRTSLSTTRDGVTWDTTTWTYDPCTSLCTSKTYADNSTVTYAYTPDNLPLRTTYASGRWKENVYDERRQVVAVEYSDGEIASFDHDAFLNEIAFSNDVAAANLDRDAKGNCTNDTVAVGEEVKTTRRTFDAFSRLTGIDGTIYDYNADGLLASISNDIALVEYAYTPDCLDAGYSLTLSNGVVFTSTLVRDGYRRSLVTGISSAANGVGVGSLAYTYDALNRPTSRNNDSFGYNARGEVVFSRRGAEIAEESYSYDDIGNLLHSAFNTVTNAYTANNLNQYTSILRASASPREVTHDVDGNMTQCCDWSYTYDAANRLKTISSNGVLLVTNFYDAKSRRVKKITSEATTTFFYDGWNLVEERIAYTNGTTSTIHYYWGKDLSGTLQGAGGVGGLLYLTIDGVPYVPNYDNIGNITRYLDANGNTVAQYTYDAFGGTLSQSGSLASFFRHRFSTKYLDVETCFYYYGYRFYRPDLGRWLNRDPIGEEGGANLYSFCNNAALYRYDIFGNIPVSVVTWRRNSFLQRLMNGGEKYSIVNVKNTSDISVEDMESSRKWGLFVSTLQIEECQVVVTLTILLNQKMPNTGNKDITYHYKPHNGEDGGIATSSDGSPQVRGGILAHEQGHADSFLESFLPRFRNEVARFKAGQLTESDKAEIRRIFARCKKEASTDSGNRANESHINWYNNNGYQIDTR